ncbi:hypothetical protein IHQ71_17795 [Rhizobium sp. TH2]|uniref:hypothetical protein n=1 Tax=Rhizobium sp. TH2 TaxID=2775403 RepID=UPI0021575C0C|nr:hypothetical protein [Rhizobium sp. TH2]UVC07074.1 hypothetical protein IHQ71_17795 [Rhizobium sp. TH2]
MAPAKKIARSQIVVRPDSKGRITLGPLAKGISSFVISKEDDGRLTLDPYKEIPAREAWLFQNPVAADKVRKGMTDLSEGRLRSRGDFTQFVEDQD